MSKTNKNAKSVNNSNTIAEVTNEVVTEVMTVEETKEETAAETILPLVDSASLVEQIESGDNESKKKKDCMDLIINNFRAPVPSALVLYGRFFRDGCPSDSDVVKTAVASSGLAPDSDDSAVAAWALGLDAPIMGAFVRAANSWWRVAGDFVDSDVESVVDFANNNTSLKNDVYFCEIKKDWLFVGGSLVVYSATNNDGKKSLLMPGCYYSVVDCTTANYIRSIRSLGAFLSAKRREMGGKVSNNFALEPAVKAYLKNVLLAGSLSASDISTIAANVAKEIEEEKANNLLVLQNKVAAGEFKVNELERLVNAAVGEQMSYKGGANTAKSRKLDSKVSKLKTQLEGAKTSLKVAQMELDKLNK